MEKVLNFAVCLLRAHRVWLYAILGHNVTAHSEQAAPTANHTPAARYCLDHRVADAGFQHPEAPQVLINRRQQSTAGWNIWTTLLDVAGGVLSIAQLVLDALLTHDVGKVLADCYSRVSAMRADGASGGVADSQTQAHASAINTPPSWRH